MKQGKWDQGEKWNMVESRTGCIKENRIRRPEKETGWKIDEIGEWNRLENGTGLKLEYGGKQNRVNGEQGGKYKRLANGTGWKMEQAGKWKRVENRTRKFLVKY